MSHFGSLSGIGNRCARVSCDPDFGKTAHTLDNWEFTIDATNRQLKEIARLITIPRNKAGNELDFQEASRMIAALRKDQKRRTAVPCKAVLEAIIQAQSEYDQEALAIALRAAKAQTKHGYWLSLLKQLEIRPRAAQRLI